ncbi:MAG: MBL fold metallo-hydrolase [Prevotellaceae bacterium]|jgi:glyoxylase-like metal-dependent hydrolase (beta-lactamase superfamily II)|nr:MBL fold metallo-hydrolase [Prevotellaceae bacterium]
MILKRFIFNPLQENTYLVYDETGESLVIDAGCQSKGEQDVLKSYIEEKGLTLIALLNTHCHFDHVFGNAFLCREYGVKSRAHRGELQNIERFKSGAALFGFAGDPPPVPSEFLEDGMNVEFGKSKLQIIYTPGHSPGGLCFYSPDDGFVISGDTLFAGSVGRTDLPGGDYNTLIESLKKLIEILPDDTDVYPGHGPQTKIGYEKLHNPFL